MTEKTGWRVVVRNDDVNMASTVAYLLHRICGMALPDAVRAMWRVQVDGSAEVGRFSGPDEAEQLAARLQSHGLHGQVRRAS